MSSSVVADSDRADRAHDQDSATGRTRLSPVTPPSPASRTDAAPAPHPDLTVLATVAHELRGPLTALATSSELLAEDFGRLDPQQIKSMLAAMHRRTLWLQGLVENLLCAAMIRTAGLQLQRDALNIVNVLSEVAMVVEPLLSQRGQRLRVRKAAGVAQVMADSRRLGQVLVNLILNASKFAAPNTAIDITISRRSDGVRVAVADRGPGVPAGQAQRLFEPYYRGPAQPGNGQDGIGLGLSIVKSIVEAHGGRVGVESRKGGGARFWFVVPAATPASTTKTHLTIVS